MVRNGLPKMNVCVVAGKDDTFGIYHALALSIKTTLSN
jgi:hypothetical protein